MKKKVVQDVIPPKKSIRNIELLSRSKETFTRPISLNKQAFINKSESVIDITKPVYNYEYMEQPKKSRKWLYLSISLFVLAVAFSVSTLFKSAEIKITPKQDVKILDENFKALKDVSLGGLNFQIVTVTKSVEKTLDSSQFTSEQKVDKKAKGIIVIYNNYSGASQKLVATTRFQTPEGLIFRLINPVTVPGQQDKTGKTVAGSIEVAVEADKAGATYNIGLKDFTIPGLKGDPKYTKIYGRSKTEMTGGLSGMQKVVSKEFMQSADNELTLSLKNSLSKDIISQIPADFILYSNSLYYKFEPVAQTDSGLLGTGGASVTVIKKNATVTAILFNRTSLTQAILAKILPVGDNSMVKITNLETLDFQYGTASSTISNATTLVNFSLKGNANLVWTFDENKLKADLLGLSKKNAKTIIGTYPTIKEAWILTRPFWNQTIPNDSKKVSLVNTLTK